MNQTNSIRYQFHRNKKNTNKGTSLKQHIQQVSLSNNSYQSTKTAKINEMLIRQPVRWLKIFEQMMNPLSSTEGIPVDDVHNSKLVQSIHHSQLQNVTSAKINISIIRRMALAAEVNNQTRQKYATKIKSSRPNNYDSSFHNDMTMSITVEIEHNKKDVQKFAIFFR